jgi:integrase
LTNPKIRQLRAEEVDLWLEGLAKTLATSTLQLVRSLLSRVVNRAMKRGMVDRNVVELCQPPTGLDGRPSKSLTFEQANDVLTLTVGDPMHCYIVVSLLTGARTEEVRALTWRHVHLDDDPAYLEVWRSVRRGGDTKTARSRRTLALPALVVEKMRTHRDAAEKRARDAGKGLDPDALVFGTSEGTEMDAANVRRDFRRALKKVPSVAPEDWTPREMRHSFVSLLSDSGVSIEEIARLVGHKGGSAVTEKVYRKQLRPVIQTGATAMDGLFAASASGGPMDA